MTPAEKVLKHLDEILPAPLIGAGVVMGAYVARREYETAKRVLAGKTRAKYGLEHDIARYRTERHRIQQSGKPMLQRLEDQEALEKRTVTLMANKIRAQRNREAKAQGKPRVVGGPVKKDIRTAKRGMYGTFGGHRPFLPTEGDI